MQRPNGFTLIELLVFMALFTLVMSAALSYFTNTTRASTLIVQREQVRGEMTLTNQLLISRLREACQVYPQSTSLTFATIPGTLRVSENTRTWRVGTDPMAAIIAASNGVPTFYAFYLLSRSDYIAQITDDTQKIPVINTTNPSFVMMQYAVPVSADACTNRPTTLPTTGATAQLVTQNVRSPMSTEAAFEVGADSAVIYRLRFETQAGKTTMVYPSLNTNPMSGAVIGRNLGP